VSDNQLRNLDKLFERKIFRVPDYQRGYAWGLRQLEDFWEDLMNLDGHRTHYTGVLTLEKINKDKITGDAWEDDVWIIQKGFTPYYIVDGQQRLTTLVILIQAITEYMSDLDNDIVLNFSTHEEIVSHYIFSTQPGGICKTYIFGYERDNPSYEYLKDKILGQYSSSNHNIETLYTHNLQFAKDYFVQKIRELAVDEVESIFRKVTLQLLFNCYEIENELDVFIAFETINNRGKALSTLELLKNRLIYLSTLLNDDEKEKMALRKMINDCWKTIYEYLGKNKEKQLNDDDFLRDHWIMYFDDAARKEAGGVAHSLLNREFTARKVQNGELKIEYLSAYVRNLQESVKVWYCFFNPEQSPFSQSIKNGLDRLNRIGYKTFTPLVLAAFVKRGNSCSDEEISRFLGTLEKFIFKVFSLSQRRANTGSAAFQRMARQLYYDKLAISSVNAQINEWTTDYFSIDRFREYIGDKFRFENQDGYYGWNSLRYFLYEYEIYNMQQMNAKIPKMTWEEFNEYRKGFETIEHIYPNRATNADWRKNFDKYSPKKQNYLKNSIGNLLALSRQKNAALQNDAFKDKVKKKRKDGTEWGYFNGSYSEMIVAQELDWKAQQIYDRGLNMIDFLCKRWSIKMDDVDKEELLFLDFI
jgi:hypothetical protein